MSTHYSLSCVFLALTLELWFDLPGLGGEAAKDVPLGVFDQQQGGPTLRNASHHPAKALSMQFRGK